jgi:hypothetical protein
VSNLLGEQLGKSTKALLPIQLIFLVGLCTVLTIANPLFLEVLIGFISTYLVLIFCWKRLAPFWLSPGILLAIFLISTGALGIVFTPYLANAGGTAGAQIDLGPSAAVLTANLFFIFSCVALLANAMFVKPAKDYLNPIRSYDLRVFDSAKIQLFAVGFSFLVLIINFAIRGLDWLLSRDERFLEESSQLLSLLSIITILAVVSLGPGLIGPSPFLRVSSTLLVFFYFLLYMSLATRTFSLIPILVLLGAFLAGTRKNLATYGVAASTSALFLSPLPLHFRDQLQHGIVPHMNSLQSFSYSGEILLKSVNNVLSGFQIVGATAFEEREIPFSYFLVSLSPELGSSAGWYDIAPALRLNYFTPYGALGEIGNQGWTVTLIFAFFLGIFFALIQNMGSVLLKNSKLGLLHIISLGIIFVFIIQFTQYNLRSEMRLLYYALFAETVLYLIALRTRHRGKESNLSKLSRLKNNVA